MLLSLVLTTLLFSSCSDKKWSAEGNIAGAAGKSVVLEAPNGTGGWYAVDTVEVAKDGSFKLTGEPFGHPELLRLNLEGQRIYFPIDSLETINIEADVKNLQASAKLSGSETADRMQEVNGLIASTIKSKGEDVAAFDPDLKRKLAEIILHNPSDIVAYYLVFHRVGNSLLFSPTEKSDLRIIGAVANAYTQNRPADPRTALLKDLYLSNRKAVMPSTATDTIVANEIGFPDISLVDELGKTRTLSEVVNNGKVVVLNFTAYTADGSQALNVELNKVYSAHKAQGIEIYQVGLDGDEFQWKQSAKNLPWITVYNTPKAGAQTLLDYNVSTLPATFIFNRQGNLVERVENINRLESTVSRYL
jgi:peroxiredoxin